jgi:hypothetical protein
MYIMCELMEHSLDDILLGVKRVRSPSGPEPKQDLLTHVDIQSYKTFTVRKELCEDRKPPTVLPHDGLDA